MGTQDYQSAMADASLLSLVLRTGALPAPVTVAETRVVGPSLGADSIRDGISERSAAPSSSCCSCSSSTG
jgi:preprotein translocase subunit SecD